ncbi:hypothetical protein CRG98_017126 [Punica granatum]|uniref:Uncharacterized protein n=2 Tax=Punica granatum TaxID=22663 RepID=A0A2I0K1T5_PUNGR|nr:hypothetical protein CRG98_017126 [Punica granatum]
MPMLIPRTVDSLFAEGLIPCKLLNVADLGCSTGPNTFTFMSSLIRSLEHKCRELKLDVPEIQFYLNDLPGNDFNTLFRRLSEFRKEYADLSCFFMGAPGSFHERLFPEKCLHLAYSLYSVHWLSRVPRLTSDEGQALNKGKIYISKTSPRGVKEAYLAQFQEDVRRFLRCRAEELRIGGRLMLIIDGRPWGGDPAARESCYTWELLAEAIVSLVSEGLVEEEKLDTLNVPYYIAAPEEVQLIVEQEGSFALEHLETITVERGSPLVEDEEKEDPWTRGRKLAKNIRIFTDSIIQHHFGFGEEIMNKLYDEKLALLIGKDMSKGPSKGTSIVLELRKN